MKTAAKAIFWLVLATTTSLSTAASPNEVEVIRGVEFGKGDSRTLKMDILRPKNPTSKPMPVVVFIHGGGWCGGTRETGIPMLMPLAEHGYFCATVDYRLSQEAVSLPRYRIANALCGFFVRRHRSMVLIPIV